MKRFHKIFLTVWILLMFSGPLVPGAAAELLEFSKRIVVFHENVSSEEVLQYVQEWEGLGVSIVMELPLINGLVLSVPVDISSAELAADPRVVSVEDNQHVRVEGVSATADGGAADGGAADGGAADGGAADGGAADGGAADGGAADGGAADGGAADGGALYSMPWWSFILPMEKPAEDHRPWGILKLYDQLQDPELLTDLFDSHDVPKVIRKALKLMARKRIRVAIFDTGVDFTHPSLAGKVKGGFDVITMTPGLPTDDNGHGTHIAGTLSAHLDEDPFGLAPPIELYSVKILDQYATGDLVNIVLGLQWAIDNDIDVANMSISYREDSPAVHLAVKKAYEYGVIMVAAAGNRSNWDDPAPTAAADGGAADGGAADGGAADGGAADGGAADGGAADGGAADGGAADGGAADGGAGHSGSAVDWYSVMYPARYPEVIAVGASTPFGEMAAFSNSGEELDLTAPGTNIISTTVWNWGGFGIGSGTSMATPHVSGAIAMMLALDSQLTTEEIMSILRETAEELEYPQGIGDLNLIGALKRVWDMRDDNEDDDRFSTCKDRKCRKESERKKNKK